ncbi:hypothetical protein N431DRAFT_467791 [Stipitochalara longipes BDJ]|nr:hypothetical protein N431DRAFT_467791 [Stipitochalara longipes BDJ]
MNHSNMQSAPQGGNPATPKSTRCRKCKKDKKGCDLAQTGFPCTRCREGNHLCEDGDIPAAYTRQSGGGVTPAREGLRPRGDIKGSIVKRALKGGRPSGKERRDQALAQRDARLAAGMTVAAPAERMDAIASTLGPAQEFQGPSMLDEGLPRRRFASPQRGVVYSDKCNNCERHGRPCEDTRPCGDCNDRNIVCNGSYLNNPYRSPKSDGESDGSGNGYGSFGQAFGSYGFGGGNEGMNDPNNSNASSA